MDTLLSILKGVAPVLATAVAGPAGGAALAATGAPQWPLALA